MPNFKLKQTSEQVQKAIDNSLNPDKTLNEEGVPADAQAVGEELKNKYSAENEPPYPVESVCGKTGAVSLTAGDVGADPSGRATGLVEAHNISGAAHNDIRLLISGLTTRLNALADSDDTTLDQLSEIVEYIKANKSLIESVTTSKVNVADIIDNLTTSVSNKPLSAKMGVELANLVRSVESVASSADAAAYRATENAESALNHAQSAMDLASSAEQMASEAQAEIEKLKENGVPGGGTSASVEEIHIGADEPTDGEKLWIDPDDDGDGLTAEDVKNALGYTPANAEAVGELSEAIVDYETLGLGVHTDGKLYIYKNGSPSGNGVVIDFAGDVIGTLDESNNIILNGDLADGTYTLKYENADGTFTEIGNLQVGELSVISISASKTKTSYTVGDTLNTNDITVIATYSDGSTKTITEYSVDSSAVQMGTAGSYNIVVSFGGASDTISITVVAAGPAYTNLYVKGGDGYLEGGRCGSDGTDRTGTVTGQIVTNYISVKVGDIVRVKGFELKTGGSAYSGIYKADKTAIKGFYPTDAYSDCVTNISKVADSFEATFTIAHAEAGFIRLCGQILSSGVIITVNQEIV